MSTVSKMGHNTRQEWSERKGTVNFLKRKKRKKPESKIVIGNGLGMGSRESKKGTRSNRN